MKQLILPLLVFFSVVSAVSTQSHLTTKEKQQAIPPLYYHQLEQLEGGK